jgi:hypothetical protein
MCIQLLHQRLKTLMNNKTIRGTKYMQLFLPYTRWNQKGLLFPRRNPIRLCNFCPLTNFSLLNLWRDTLFSLPDILRILIWTTTKAKIRGGKSKLLQVQMAMFQQWTGNGISVAAWYVPEIYQVSIVQHLKWTRISQTRSFKMTTSTWLRHRWEFPALLNFIFRWSIIRKLWKMWTSDRENNYSQLRANFWNFSLNRSLIDLNPGSIY